jgi:hypothetical protein
MSDLATRLPPHSIDAEETEDWRTRQSCDPEYSHGKAQVRSFLRIARLVLYHGLIKSWHRCGQCTRLVGAQHVHMPKFSMEVERRTMTPWPAMLRAPLTV